MKSGAQSSSDHGVAETAFDALKCKLSAVELGYFEDPFLHHFVTKGTRRLPLIHRGYYLRQLAVTKCVERFVTTAGDSSCQILSLGAGFDTLFFRLRERKLLQHAATFVEVDSLAICETKKQVLLENAQVFAHCCGDNNAMEIQETSRPREHFKYSVANSTTCSYHLLACDLGELLSLEQLLRDTGIDPAKPTLVLAECVLSYVDPLKGTELLTWLARFFEDVAMVLYDPFGLDDAFGSTLCSYFAAKGCELRGLHGFCSMEDQMKRFLNLSKWSQFAAMDLNTVYNEWVDDEERNRLAGIEPFDEFAEWTLCNAHYALVVVSNRLPRRNDDNSAEGCESPTHAIISLATPRRLVGSYSADLHFVKSSAVIVRSFAPQDKDQVRSIFERTHLEYAESAKAVKRFVASRLRTDMQHIETSYLRPARHGFWVAEQNERVVGCIALKRGKTERSAELCRLGVDKAFRRQGIARLLVDTLELFARACNYDEVQADTIDHMQSAQQMYQALGYQHSSQETFRGFSIVSFVKKM